MRRGDIQLLASARQGDAAARCEVGRRYLRGEGGFARHPELGLEYLVHRRAADDERASTIIAESLSLHEIVRLGQLPELHVAANAHCLAAQVKLGNWLALTCEDLSASAQWFRAAASAGHAGAQRALRCRAAAPVDDPAALLISLADEPVIDQAALLCLSLAQALRARSCKLLERNLACALSLELAKEESLCDIACDVLAHVQGLLHFELPHDVSRTEALLENCVHRGNAVAAFLLGRALCGLDAGPLRARSLTTSQNMRKGAALLLRAADAGKIEAWCLLFRVHSDNHSSVANAQMARFFLEKAACGDDVVAQRRLGALVLRSATTVHELETGIHWLHKAALQQDSHAAGLLQSLVLGVAGSEQEAARVIDGIRREDPGMACRLRTARDFGLTKLEALSVDLAAAIRPWGMVVGPNQFITQAGQSAARAIPALRPDAALNLRRSAAFMEQARHDGAPPRKGDLRKRSVRCRCLLEKHGVGESLFFAKAKATTLNSLRTGTKWAFRTREPLLLALAA